MEEYITKTVTHKTIQENLRKRPESPRVKNKIIPYEFWQNY